MRVRIIGENCAGLVTLDKDGDFLTVPMDTLSKESQDIAKEITAARLANGL